MAVTGARRSRFAAVTVVATLLALTGCSGTAADPHRTVPTPSASAPSPTATAETSGPTGAPSPGSMTTPRTTSGPLSQASFPTPRRLGAGWSYSVDPGDAEEGYAGNGTPAVERFAPEIVQTAVPFGCDRRSRMPAPRYALEVDYSVDGTKAIAVRAMFADRAAARAFFAGRARNLRDCVGRTGSTAIGPLVARLARPVADALVSDRTPRSDPWRELAVLDGSAVVLLAVQGTDHLTAARARRLVPLFRD